MTRALAFEVSGTPRPQPRPRFVGGRVISTVSPGVKVWRALMRRAILKAMDGLSPFGGPVSLEAEFRFRAPANALDRIGKPHTQRPDGDNLVKAMMDEMQAAGVFGDDSTVASLTVSKRWSANPGCGVCVREVENGPGVHAETPGWLTGKAV